MLEPNSGHRPRDYLTEKEPVISILPTEFYLPEEADEFVVWLLIRILSSIERELERLVEYGGSDNESSIRRAFAVCLDSYCRDHREKLALVDELGFRAVCTRSGR